MAVTIFDRLISLKDWFTKTNTLFTSVGDTSLLDPSLGSNIVNGINSVDTKLGDATTLDAGINVGNEVVGSLTKLSDDITRSRIAEGEPLAYDMFPIAVFGSDTDFDAHGMVE